MWYPKTFTFNQRKKQYIYMYVHSMKTKVFRQFHGNRKLRD